MSKRNVPGLIPWIALLVLLLMMVNTMERISDHIFLMQLNILDLHMDVEDEKDEFVPEYYPNEVPERMRIALTVFLGVKG